MLEIQVTKTTTPKNKPDQTKLGFGKYFSDHMFVMEYEADKGWHQARIEPYHAFSLDPSCAVLHYAQEVFEGLKAYRTSHGIQLFRPEKNAQRFQNSCQRMCIPTIPVEDFVQAVKKLVKLEEDWVPGEPGTSLYIRPFVFASVAELGVHASPKYIFCIICSPVGSYYANGLAPISIYVEDEYIRTAPGLTGFAKCGGNYAASLKSSTLAKELGYDQVLWLDGIHHQNVEEVGAMNIFFKIQGEIYTADCTGTVLPGVTRDSVITLCKQANIPVHIGPLPIEKVIEAAKHGTLEEVFGTGTAAVISPVKILHYHGQDYMVGNGEIGEFTSKLYDTLTGIQWGKQEDLFGWTTKI